MVSYARHHLLSPRLAPAGDRLPPSGVTRLLAQPFSRRSVLAAGAGLGLRPLAGGLLGGWVSPALTRAAQSQPTPIQMLV